MSKRKGDIVFAVIAVILICLAMVFLSGCIEEEQRPQQWGQGELPADHQEYFGNDNTARLDYVQNRVLDKHGAILKVIAIRVLALEAVDPNAMRLEALESGMEKLTLVEPVE